MGMVSSEGEGACQKAEFVCPAKLDFDVALHNCTKLVLDWCLQE